MTQRDATRLLAVIYCLVLFFLFLPVSNRLTKPVIHSPEIITERRYPPRKINAMDITINGSPTGFTTVTGADVTTVNFDIPAGTYTAGYWTENINAAGSGTLVEQVRADSGTAVDIFNGPKGSGPSGPFTAALTTTQIADVNTAAGGTLGTTWETPTHPSGTVTYSNIALVLTPVGTGSTNTQRQSSLPESDNLQVNFNRQGRVTFADADRLTVSPSADFSGTLAGALKEADALTVPGIGQLHEAAPFLPTADRLTTSILGPELYVRLFTFDGKRKRLPAEWVSAVSWEYSERGGWDTGELTLQKDFDISYLIGTEYVEFWLFGQRMFRGWPRVVENSLADPDSLRLSLYGLQERLAGYNVLRDYCFPGQTSIDIVFTKIVTEATRGSSRMPNLQIDTADIPALNLTVDQFTGSNKSLPQVLNSLCEQFPHQIIWGCEVDSFTGLDRIYLRPRYSKVRYNFFDGPNVKSFVYPPDSSQVVNRVFLTGGKVNPPNLLYNGSFETCLAPSDLTTNLLMSPSFEDSHGGTFPNWQVNGNPTSDALYSYDGGLSAKMDNNPTAPERLFQDRPYIVTQPIAGSVWVRQPVGESWTFDIRLQILDSAKHIPPLAELSSGPITPPSDGVWRQYFVNWNPPADSRAQYARFIIDCLSGSGRGMNVDSAAMWYPAGVIADGWNPSGSVNASTNLLDWNNADADIQPVHGSTVLKIDPLITASGGYVELRNTLEKRVQIKPSRSYYGCVWVKPVNPAVPVQFQYILAGWQGNTFKSEAASPVLTFSGLNSMFNGWYQVTLNFVTGSTSDGMDAIFRFYGGACYIDASGIWAGNLPNQYYPGDTFQAVRDTFFYASGFPNPDVGNSILIWGDREKPVTIDTVVDTASLDAYCLSFFPAHAVPVVQAKLELANVGSPVKLDGMVRLANLQPSIPPLFPSRIRYSVTDNVEVDIDLNNEREDMALLLRNVQERRV